MGEKKSREREGRSGPESGALEFDSDLHQEPEPGDTENGVVGWAPEVGPGVPESGEVPERKPNRPDP